MANKERPLRTTSARSAVREKKQNEARPGGCFGVLNPLYTHFLIFRRLSLLKEKGAFIIALSGSLTPIAWQLGVLRISGRLKPEKFLAGCFVYI